MGEKSTKKLQRKAFFSGVIATLLAIALLYFLYMTLPIGIGASHPDTAATIRKTKEIQRLVDRYYLGDVDEQTMTDTLFLGQVAGLGDRYSTYYTKEQYEQVKKSRAGAYTGIGVTIARSADDSAIEIVSVEEGTPADEAGIRAGDLILEVEGENVTSDTTGELTERIAENTGKSITMKLKRPADEAADSEDSDANQAGTAEGTQTVAASSQEDASVFTVEVTPRKLETETVTGSMVNEQIGLIHITEFSKVTSDQFKETLESLQSQGMTKLILDLRDNGGGLVSSACAIGRQILPQGIIVYEEDKNGERIYERNEEDNGFSMPLAVLVNENTASAAEILAGAIHDDEIGTLIGTKTFGKGIVQDDFLLSDGSCLKLTVRHYFTPDGNDIHGKGIEPDIEVEAANDGTDPQLDRAVQELS